MTVYSMLSLVLPAKSTFVDETDATRDASEVFSVHADTLKLSQQRDHDGGQFA